MLGLLGARRGSLALCARLGGRTAPVVLSASVAVVVTGTAVLAGVAGLGVVALGCVVVAAAASAAATAAPAAAVRSLVAVPVVSVPIVPAAIVASAVAPVVTISRRALTAPAVPGVVAPASISVLAVAVVLTVPAAPVVVASAAIPVIAVAVVVAPPAATVGRRLSSEVVVERAEQDLQAIPAAAVEPPRNRSRLQELVPGQGGSTGRRVLSALLFPLARGVVAAAATAPSAAPSAT